MGERFIAHRYSPDELLTVASKLPRHSPYKKKRNKKKTCGNNGGFNFELTVVIFSAMLVLVVFSKGVDNQHLCFMSCRIRGTPLEQCRFKDFKEATNKIYKYKRFSKK